jgi:hypothetical protein
LIADLTSVKPIKLPDTMQLASSIVSGRSAYASNARIEIEFRPFLLLQIKKKLLPFAINLVVPLAKSRVIIAGFTKNLP